MTELSVDGWQQNEDAVKMMMQMVDVTSAWSSADSCPAAAAAAAADGAGVTMMQMRTTCHIVVANVH